MTYQARQAAYEKTLRNARQERSQVLSAFFSSLAARLRGHDGGSSKHA